MWAILLAAAQAVAPGTLEHLRADEAFLTQPAQQGRGTPSRGLDQAARYLGAALEAAGLHPAGTKKFLQPYEVLDYGPVEHGELEIGSHRARGVPLLLGIDPATFPRKAPFAVLAQETAAPADLRGKIVIALQRAESDRASMLGATDWYGRWIDATTRGALAFVYVVSPETGVERAAQALAGWPTVSLPGRRRPTYGAGACLVVSAQEFDRTLAEELGGTYAELLARSLEPRAGPARFATLSIPHGAPRRAQAENVVALAAGRDPSLAEQWIVLSAHFDHLGTQKERLYPGADDNASGTAAVLEVARRLARTPARRSVLILLTSGEERGFLGSTFFGDHPTIPMARLACDINIDMVGRAQGVVEASPFGASDLLAQAVAAAAGSGMTVVPDRHPEWRMIYLSDDYVFAQAGRPTLSFFTGLHADYHQPTDTPDKIRYDDLVAVVTVIERTVRRIADAQDAPRWTPPPWFTPGR